MAALVGVSAFATAMREQPIALFPRDANVQHYEVPSAFFEQVLGPQLKYSCCLYPAADTTLAQAEEFALAETALHADLADGQEILELGCGWGSLTLWMAERFPAARITAVSNSAPQRVHIERRAAERGLVNLQVITADMNNFAIARRFDRVVSVEMFEHMSNWPRLLANVHDWLRRGGGCFCTSSVIRRRRIGSTTTTAQDWIARLDDSAETIDAVLRATYRQDWMLWRRRWRLFFLATAGLFGARAGSEWGVSHYRLRAMCACSPPSTPMSTIAMRRRGWRTSSR